MDVVADVVKHRGGAQQQAVALAEGVHALQVVEQLGGETADLARVALVEVVPASEAGAGLEDPLSLASGVPHVKKLVDELFERPCGEADPGR
jgi:hypothetical protein